MISDEILAFSHIPKTAGTTLNYILKRHFAHRHLLVEYRKPPPVYTSKDLDFDLKINPAIRSIAGHTLKPYVDFGRDLTWFTFLRNPVDRFLSHYQHQYRSVEKFRIPLRDWMRTYERQNWMTRMIAGTEDVEAAKQILANFAFVGLMERFDESLLLLKHLAIPDLDIAYKPKNVSARMATSFDDHLSEVIEQNSLDIELYEYAENRLQSQLDSLGEQEIVTAFDGPSIRDRINIALCDAYRHAIYRPVVWLDRRRSVPNPVLTAPTLVSMVPRILSRNDV